jgi:2-keto-4-pentenoate hydratase
VAADDIRGAYAVQQINVSAAQADGRRRVGRKIGLTSQAVQLQLGVDQPDYGVLFGDVVFDAGQVPLDGLMQPKAEAEIAFVLGQDLAGPGITTEQARRAVAGVLPAIEVADSRIAGWDITFVDTVADNASAGLAVLGTRIPLPSELDLPAVQMSLRKNGAEASTGFGSASLGDPMKALVWLANAASELGDPLQAGEIVLTGALGPVVEITAGDVVDVELSQLGSVQASFDGPVQ